MVYWSCFNLKKWIRCKNPFFNGLKHKELDTFLFFTIYTPLLRIIDFFKLLCNYDILNGKRIKTLKIYNIY